MSLPPKLIDGPLKYCPPPSNTTVPGFKAAAISCGLRADGREDLALIVADEPADAAGMFTTNRMFAAPVGVARANIAGGKVRAILANSGGANAATGQPGMEACRRTCVETAQNLGCTPEQVIPCSTGVIGQVLDADKVCGKINALKSGLRLAGIENAAGAIMTTDAFRKMSSAKAVIDGKAITVVGMTKGAGMIRPDMATTLCFILTDAEASPEALKQVLSSAMDHSFHRITVDGDMSTNDTALLLASGKAGNSRLEPGAPGIKTLTEAVTSVAQDLAQMMVCDGEGAGRMALFHLTGAADENSARKLSFAIGNSPLVKTALASPDAYWGRMLSAAGAEASREGLPFDPAKSRVWIQDIQVAEGGVRTSSEAEEQAGEAMKTPRVRVRIDLGLGDTEYWIMASDLDHGYIELNVAYRS